MSTASRSGTRANSTSCEPSAAPIVKTSAGRPKLFVPSAIRGSSNGPRLPETGKVDTFVVVHYAAVAAFQPDLPYVVAHIAIDGTDGQVQIIGNVIGCPWQEVKVGYGGKGQCSKMSRRK